MKNWLLYYYNLNIKEIYPKTNDYLIFTNDDEIYLMKKYDESSMDINNLNNVNKNYNLINSNYYLLITNKLGSSISKIEDENYVLLKIKGLIGEIVEIEDIYNNLRMNSKFISNFNLDWRELWQKRVDYIEYQIGQLGKNKKEVIDSFSFFSGLAENAISFISLNHIDYKNCRTSLCHKRISYPNEAIDYYESFVLKIDYEIRDLAEYIKSKLIINGYLDQDLDFVVNKCDYNNDELKLFYARLMFPSNYLDLIEEIMISNTSENKIETYIEKSEDYINFLKDAYIELSKKMELLIPNWIKVGN